MRSPLSQFATAALVLLGVTLLCFHPLAREPSAVLVGPQRSGWNDLTTYFIGVHSFPRQCLADFGQWPLWNPYRSCGMPHLGNPQSAVFYPPNWLCWWFDAAHVLSWSLAAHHWFAGLGCYLLCRRFEFAWIAAVAGGAIFLAAPYLIAQSGEGHYAQICAVAWTPWALLAYEALRSGSRTAMVGSAIVGLSAALAMSFFAGHAQELYYLVLILSAWVLVDSAAKWLRAERLAAARLVASWLLAAVTAFGLVAVEFLPILTYMGQVVRSQGLSATEAGEISMSLPNMLQLLNPFALGDPISYAGVDNFFWESVCSFGIAPLVLAVFGVMTVGWRYPVARLAVTGLVALGFGFGASGPVFRFCFAFVPGMTMFRVPSRVLFFCSLVVAVLAAAGADSLVRVTRNWSVWRQLAVRRILLALGLACLAMFAALQLRSWIGLRGGPAGADRVTRFGSSQSDPLSHEALRAAVLDRAFRRSFGSSTTYAWFLGAFGLTYIAVRRPSLASSAVAGLLCLSIAQLIMVCTKLLAALPSHDFYRASPGLPAMASADLGRVLTVREFLPDHVSLTQRIFKIQAYDPLPLSRYADFFAALVAKRDPTSNLMGYRTPDVTKLREHLLDLGGVRWVLLSPSQSASDREGFAWQFIANESIEPFRLRGNGRPRHPGDTSDALPCAVYENTDSMPRAFVVGQTEVLPRGADAVSALAELDPRRELLMNAEYLPPGPRAEFARAEIVEYTANRVVVEAELGAVGYLVLSDTWYPGWTATDNGRPTSVIPANLAFRAVPLSPGRHRVEFQFCPHGLAWGALASLATWLACGVRLILNTVGVTLPREANVPQRKLSNRA